jgi:hypothetical protein
LRQNPNSFREAKLGLKPHVRKSLRRLENTWLILSKFLQRAAFFLSFLAAQKRKLEKLPLIQPLL